MKLLNVILLGAAMLFGSTVNAKVETPNVWIKSPYTFAGGEVYFFGYNKPVVGALAVQFNHANETFNVVLINNDKEIKTPVLKRLVAWDNMGRLSEELLLDRSLTLSEIIRFFDENDSFSVNWGETGFVEGITIEPGATTVLRNTYKLLQHYRFN